MTGSRSLTPKSLFRIQSSMPDETKTIARERKMGLCFRFNRHRTDDRLHTRHQLVFQNTPCVEAVERVIRKRRVPCERRVGMLRFGRRGALGVPLGNLGLAPFLPIKRRGARLADQGEGQPRLPNT